MNNEYYTSENYFEYLAKYNPIQLIEILTSNVLENSELTFALEIAGKNIFNKEIIQILFWALNHENKIVREGALLGIAYQNDSKYNEVINKKVSDIISNDKSSACREVANDVLEHRKEMIFV